MFIKPTFLVIFFAATIGFSKNEINAKAKSSKYVIILSWDGFGLNVYNKTKPLQNLETLIKKGAFALNAQAVSPTITLPNHASMISGVEPKVHKVLWNDWKPESGIITVPTIFDLAKQSQLTTAMIVGKEKFRHLYNAKTVDQFVLKENASSIAKAAAQIILNDKPNLMFIHFPDPDIAGHRHGWLSPEQSKSVENCDLALKEIIDAVKQSKIEDKLSWIITSDHGGHEKSHGTDKVSDRQIPWILSGRGVTTSIIKTPISAVDTAAQAAQFLGLKKPKTWLGRPALNQ